VFYFECLCSILSVWGGGLCLEHRVFWEILKIGNRVPQKWGRGRSRSAILGFIFPVVFRRTPFVILRGMFVFLVAYFLDCCFLPLSISLLVS